MSGYAELVAGFDAYVKDCRRTGYGAGYQAGAAWALEVPPWADVLGFSAVDNVQETGFDSDDYATGYDHGVWRTWCARHGLGHVDCLTTEPCRQVVRRAAMLMGM